MIKLLHKYLKGVIIQKINHKTIDEKETTLLHLKLERVQPKRGSLTFWFDKESIKAWHDVEKIDDRECPPTYSEVAILCALSLKVICKGPLQGTEGLLCSLVELMGLPIKVPDYTTLTHHQAKLRVEIPYQVELGNKKKLCVWE